MSDSTTPEVCCQDCGFLAVRNRETRALAETEASMRETGESPDSAHQRGMVYYERIPICFVREKDLIKEAGGTDSKTEFLRVIQAKRRCPAHTKWYQGFTPKEHKEMIDAQKQQEWQRKVEQEDREREEKRQEREAARWDEQRRLDLAHRDKLDAERDAESRKATKRFWIQLCVGGILLSALSIASTWLLAIRLRETPQVERHENPDRTPPRAP